MSVLGTARERAHYQRMIALKDFSSTPVGGTLRDNAYKAFLEQIGYDFRRRQPRIGAPIQGIRQRCRVFAVKEATPELIAAIAVCAIVDCMMLRMTYPQACGYVGKQIDDELKFIVFRRQHAEYWMEVEREKNRRGIARAKQRLVEMSKKFTGLDRSSARERSKAGLYILSTFERVTQLITTYKISKPNGRQARYLIPTEAAADWIDRAIEDSLHRHPFYLPCIDLPADWDAPFGGGYITGAVAQRPLVRSHSKEYIETLEQADLSQVYGAVNTLQHTAWEVNAPIFAIQEEIYKSGASLAGCYDGTRVKIPTKPEACDLPGDDGLDARREYRRAAARVHEINHLAKVRRLTWGKTLATARMFFGKQFYFPHHLDFRGRVYPTASIMTPQGDDQSIALLKFKEGQKVATERDWWWVRVQGAGLFGIDKVPFEQRLDWVNQHTEHILESAKDPFACRWWAAADSPMSFLAWCMEYAKVTHDNNANWHLPITIDGSNNGLQVYSFLLRDPVGGAATNCVPSDSPHDIYQDVADIVTEKLGKRAVLGDVLANRWLAVVGGKIPRAATKRIVMTTPYGCTKFACLKYTAEWYEEFCRKTNTNEFALSLYKDLEYLSDLIWDSIDAVVVSARKGMDWLRQCADIFSAQKMNVRWTTPVGFEILQKYTKLSGSKSVNLVFGKRVERVAYRDQTKEVDGKRQRNGLAPNVIHSLDAAVLMEVVNRAQRAGCESFRAVHDSFGALPKDMDLVSKCVRESYSEIFSGDLLADLRGQWQAQMPEGVDLPDPPRQGLMSINQVLKSQYFFA